jgi:hypothetical protein
LPEPHSYPYSSFERYTLSTNMASSSVRLCSYCSMLVPLDKLDLSDPPHHTTIGALRWSSNTCGVCRYILHNLNIPAKVGTATPALAELENGAFDSATVDFSVTRRHALEDGLTSAEFTFITKIGPQSFSDCIVISTCEVSCKKRRTPYSLALTCFVSPSSRPSYMEGTCPRHGS